MLATDEGGVRRDEDGTGGREEGMRGLAIVL
jgi:hypothetical protein